MVENREELTNAPDDLDGETEEYKAFVNKFKPKKTTDDCYTPPIVYEAVLNYVVERYDIDRNNVIRPFWPGADYQAVEYPDGACVVDNPPFSCITAIVKWYMSKGIKFFIFAPYLTNFGCAIDGVTHIIAPHDVTYENGAKVATCFVTNLEPSVLARTDVKLLERIAEADAHNLAMSKKPEMPKYKYPDSVLTATMLGYMANHGVDFTVKATQAIHIRSLASQRVANKAIFGSGFLLSKKAAAEKAAAEKAAAEKAAAIVWTLSDHELKLIEALQE